MRKISAVFSVAIMTIVSGAAVSAHAADTIKYLIFAENGTQMGQQVVEHDGDGLTRVKFTFKDNGRGPDLAERFRIGADGALSDYAVKGNSTYGASVDEHFERKGTLASWSSTSEKGSRNVDGAAMYVPLNGSFEVASATITALAARPDGSMPLLPSGTLTQRMLDRLDVTANGKTQTVQLLAQTGLGLSPAFYWATTGAKPRLFAVIEPGYMTFVEEGWQAAGPVLAARQKTAEAALLGDLAAQLQHRLDGLTVVRNARIFDSATATVGAPSDVYVLRGRITAVLPAGAPVRGAVSEIDAAGRIMLPGLFDMHAHIGRWDGGLHLSAGVTSVRDMGNDNQQLQLMLDETAAGKLLAPQIVPAGFLEGASPFSANNGFVIKDLAQAKNAVDWYAEHGYPQLKIYNSFPPPILAETVAYAHSRGLRVSGHVPAGLRAQDAIDDGFDEIQHINQIMLNFLVTPTTDTRTLERFTLPAQKVADLDFDSAPVQDFIATMKRKQIVLDETLATFAFLKQRDGDINEPYAPVAGHMPPDVKRGFAVGTMEIKDAATLKLYEKSYAKMIEFVGRLYRAGVPLVAGTDDIPGFTLQAELELLVKAGLSPAQALQVATRNGATYTRTSKDRGSIEAGKLADLVLVDGDPTRDIGDIRKVAAVITRGYLIYPREIDQAFGIAPFVAGVPALQALAPVSSNIAIGGNGQALQRVFGNAAKRE